MNLKEKIIIRNIIAIFILLGPIIDLGTGLSLHLSGWSLTIGILCRMFFLIFICGIVLFYFKKKNVLIPYLLIGLYGAFYLLGIFEYKEGIGLFSEMQGLLKVFYFPILWISFYEIRDDIRISKLTLFTTLFLYLFLIFVPLTLNIGFETYKITKEGTLGFYNSANEISGIISILTPIMFLIINQTKSLLSKIIFIGIYLMVILMIGTKTPLLALGITLFFHMLYVWVYWIHKKEYKKVGVSLGVLIIAIISLWIMIPKTNFYKNIKTHLEFLQVEKITDVFKDKELIDHFIFSQRITFLKEKAALYKESSTYQKMFGIGYLNNGEEVKMIEMDYFDIYYSHGLIGFLLYMGLCLVPLYRILEKRHKETYEQYMLSISFGLIVILSLVTGHIVTAPSVSILCVVLLLYFNENEKKEIIAFTKEKDLLKELSNIKNKNWTITIIEDKKSNNLFHKILNYDIYDLSICDENSTSKEKEEARMYSFNNAIIYYKEKINKKDLENFRYILKDSKKQHHFSKEENQIIDIHSKKLEEGIQKLL